MQAGTLVTATKSLFQGLKLDGNLADAVSNMSLSLKSMNLNRLGMALTLMELDGHRLRYCAAGIPPMLIYHAKEDTAEKLKLVACPSVSPHTEDTNKPN